MRAAPLFLAALLALAACGDACPEDSPGGGVLCIVVHDAGADADADTNDAAPDP